MMIAIESEGLFRTFMEFIFVLFQRFCSVSQDFFMLSYFDKLLRCCRQCLGKDRRGVVLLEGVGQNRLFLLDLTDFCYCI